MLRPSSMPLRSTVAVPLSLRLSVLKPQLQQPQRLRRPLSSPPARAKPSRPLKLQRSVGRGLPPTPTQQLRSKHPAPVPPTQGATLQCRPVICHRRHPLTHLQQRAPTPHPKPQPRKRSRMFQWSLLELQKQRARRPSNRPSRPKHQPRWKPTPMLART